jgi:hypothetical protein
MKVVLDLVDRVRLSSDWSQADVVAETLEALDQVAFGASAGEAVQVSIAEVLVRSSGLEHVIEDHENFVSHGDRRAAKTAPRLGCGAAFLR